MEKLHAWLDKHNVITISSHKVDLCQKTSPYVKVDKKVISVESIEIDCEGLVHISLEQGVPLGKKIVLCWGDEYFLVYPRKIVHTNWFDNQFDASDSELGSFYTKGKTVFSVWAPTATDMKLRIGDQLKQMKRQNNGVWTVNAYGDCLHMTYQFVVTVNGKVQVTNDPYAKAMTANSEKSVVVDLSKTNPNSFREVDYPKIKKQDAIIYELHVRDATKARNSGVKHRGQFIGLTEVNTTNESGYSTGLSYIKELGCTHVQLLPIQDFARVNEKKPDQDYNWGYDPLFFFVPEGSYATDADQPSLRIRECKEMIKAFHQQGISVILDVVFNHVFSMKQSAFEKLVPGYYFRYQDDGQPSNGSGTGNDLATERNMVRKFINDAIDYWLSEYQVDGFRFDLMGLMDIETMKQIVKRCESEPRPILLLGEGWNLDTPLAQEKRAVTEEARQLPSISFFNDKFRDSLKGMLFDQYDQGYVNGHGRYIEKLSALFSGACDNRFSPNIFPSPMQSINYVECHDNHTLFDRLQVTNGEDSIDVKKKMHQLATGLTILSQGIPFLHAGQEFFRTKHGDENSYLSGDAINQLDWDQRELEDENITWIQQLIQLRKSYSVFRLESRKDIQERVHMISTPNPLFGCVLLGKKEDIVVLANPTRSSKKITMPSQGCWEQLLSNQMHSSVSEECSTNLKTTIDRFELAVWKKNRL
ncbi:type I pullulanase [Gracilibacillus sp. YIM 98692]|uniref:type I pullulanase n=1 Tax=Gracilibacillus sp. YIM 98692 TaxID=2663532 RepID=UPI0013D79D4B|nr:type I pullulanase [Gracilibacillus sp. YIM 98692]